MLLKKLGRLALNKCPGVRPISIIGEFSRKSLGKVMPLVTCMDVEEVCEIEQLCSGLKAGIKGLIHGM